jgi:hypothetical protein
VLALAALKIAILTLTPGSDLFARFGHTAILVEDGARHTVYNYGAYNGHDPAIVSQFLVGEVPYYLSVGDYESFLRQYAARTITGQWLALDEAEARRLADFLAWNARPENSVYRYDWFRNNCTTKTRDAVDRALDGVWRARASREPGRRSLRQILRRALFTLPSVHLTFSIGLNARVDAPLSRWDEMAMPDTLMEGLRATRRLDGRPLVAGEWEWRGPAPRAKVEPGWLVPALAAALLLLLCAGAFGSGRLARALGGIGLFAWSLTAGFLGTWMFVWLFLPYDDARWSANLIAWAPLWLALTPSGIACARGRLSFEGRMRAWRLIEIVLALTLIELCAHAIAGRQQHLGFTAYALGAMALSWLTVSRSISE